ncbi:MAG: hypothetical protein SF051_04850 [Elusimicrobiota bacterium]|nr:hypothetical protein [Elusimicrobiota bacterium]
MAPESLTRRFAGRDFLVELRDGQSAQLRRADGGFGPLETALSLAWAKDPAALSEALWRREDWSWEGFAGFAYADGGDSVCVSAEGENEVLRVAEFEAVAAGFALAVLEREAAAGTEDLARRFRDLLTRA